MPQEPALAEPSLPRHACHQKSGGFEGSRIELLVTQPEQSNSKEKVLCSLCTCKHGAHFSLREDSRKSPCPQIQMNVTLVTLKREDAK